MNVESRLPHTGSSARTAQSSSVMTEQSPPSGAAIELQLKAEGRFPAPPPHACIAPHCGHLGTPRDFLKAAVPRGGGVRLKRGGFSPVWIWRRDTVSCRAIAVSTHAPQDRGK